MDYQGQRVLILGLAREGVSLAHYFSERGARVTVTDAASAEHLRPRLEVLRRLPIQYVLGCDAPSLVSETDAFFVSPGVPETNPVYAAARTAGLPIESMTTLFFDLCPVPITAVTGSSGKTTTTGLIGHILRAAGQDVAVGGNIGAPMLDLLPRISPTTQVVLELSSFQLDILRRSPHVAVVTNISPNHLDRHGTMGRYIEAKRQIVAHQTNADFAVLNASDRSMPIFRDATPGRVRYFGRECVPNDGSGIRDGRLGLVQRGDFSSVMRTDEVPLLGEHNLENVLAAIEVGALLGIEPDVMREAVLSFRPAPHRLQMVARVEDVSYIDDSIATSPARAAVALRAITSPVILIAGGRDKHLPWDEFATLAVQKARALLLIGEAASLIEGAVRHAIERADSPALALQQIRRCSTLFEAVREAQERSQPGDTVLLSPGCTSYDMFIDFEERGAAFARAVEELHAA